MLIVIYVYCNALVIVKPTLARMYNNLFLIVVVLGNGNINNNDYLVLVLVLGNGNINNNDYLVLVLNTYTYMWY